MSPKEKHAIKLTSIIALSYSLIFTYLIFRASMNDYTLTVDFNAVGEAWIEIWLIPLTVLISAAGFGYASKY